MFTTVVLAAALFGTSPAQPAVVHKDRSDCRRSIESAYSRRYYRVARKLGRRAPGRNIRRYGLTDRRRTQCHQLTRSIRTFDRWLAPPVGAVRSGDRSSASANPASAGGGYSIPRGIVMCESGGDYNAVNKGGSGARGAYQIMSETHAAICPDLGWSPPDQDACAARIWAQQGRGAWSC